MFLRYPPNDGSDPFELHETRVSDLVDEIIRRTNERYYFDFIIFMDFTIYSGLALDPTKFLVFPLF
jgi:hypothetical protein